MPDNFNHVSFDIETLDTCASAVVLSIGAVKFNIDDDETFAEIHADTSRTFYASLEFQTQLDLGRTISADTISWWMKQNDAARYLFSENKYPPARAIDDLTAFCKGTNYAWGNGNMFDNAIIRSLYGTFGMQYPYRYSRDLDLRTYKLAAGSPKIEITTEGMVKHHALDDAIFQAISMQKFHAIIGVNV